MFPLQGARGPLELSLQPSQDEGPAGPAEWEERPDAERAGAGLGHGPEAEGSRREESVGASPWPGLRLWGGRGGGIAVCGRLRAPLAACLLFSSPQPRREAHIAIFLLVMRKRRLREVKELSQATQCAWRESTCFPVPGPESQASVLLLATRQVGEEARWGPHRLPLTGRIYTLTWGLNHLLHESPAPDQG